MESRLPSLPVKNHGLFSNHYLQHILPTSPEWSSNEHEGVFGIILEIFEREKAFLKPNLRESQLENHFFRPVFGALGFTLEVQADVPASADFPDYALFKDRGDLDDAHRNKGTRDFYNKALAVGEVKKWDTELDRLGRDRHDKRRNPSFQIWLYLQETTPLWGILSNGRKWRLYHKDSLLDSYYEVDLVRILETVDVEAFRNFYYFFRKEAFIPCPDGLTFLNRVLRGSETYAHEVGENLKENVYKALRLLAQGFFNWSDNGLDTRNETHLQLVQDNVMRLLYRLLFILYAEGRGLLSTPSYLESDYSIHKLKHEIAEKRDAGYPVLPTGGSYWTRLRDLFGLIDLGSEALGISRDSFYVPPYNGGLFDRGQNEFLERHVIGDYALAEAVDLLARAPSNGGPLGFVDYSTLGIRHLGSIYEGLLEYRLRIAAQPMVAVGTKLKWTDYQELASQRKKTLSFEELPSENRAGAGDLYLTTESNTRKATGSYYTPESIVKYIVEHTLGPILDEKWKKASETGERLKDATLSVRVLDPAMGSGHFLVGATEFLAARLLRAIEIDVEKGWLADEEVAHCTPDWAKREVIAHCIYGVDLNELAVELAKVSLWLATISKEKPLSFLDHHLKCGNSLIGSRIVDLAWLPHERPKNAAGHYDKPFGLVEKIITRLSELDSISDETIDDVKRKAKLFHQLVESDEYLRIKALADVHTGLDFIKADFESIRKGYMDLVNEAYYGNREQWLRRFGTSWAQEAEERGKQMHFFHWELEFPDVFFEDGAVKERKGFDAVVGNPPYVRIYRGRISEEDTAYYTRVFEAAHMKFDLYLLFVEMGLNILAPGGRFSMIIPDKWMSSPYGEPLRKKILKLRFESLLDLRGTRVFEGVAVDNVIPIISKNEAREEDTVDILLSQASPSGLMEVFSTARIKQSDFRELDGSQIRTEMSGSSDSLLRKIRAKSIPLGKICYVNWGLRTGTKEKTLQMISNRKEGPTYKPLIRGDDIDDRYSIAEPTQFIDYDVSRLYNAMFPELFENPKIFFRKISGERGLMAVIDEGGNYGFSTVIVAIRHTCLEGIKRTKVIPPTPESREYENLRYLLALVNSKLLRWYYDTLLSDKLSVVPNHVKELPIRKIVFSTPESRCSKLIDEGKRMYEAYLDDRSFERWNDFLQERLSATPGESDIVYMLLDYLADCLLKMHREKHKAVRNFLEWVGSPIGLGVSLGTLANRARFEKFYKQPMLGTTDDCEELERVFARNKVKIDGDQLVRFRAEYEKAARTLTPLLQRAAATDALIDFITYMLYGLSQDEIALVEKCQANTV